MNRRLRVLSATAALALIPVVLASPSSAQGADDVPKPQDVKIGGEDTQRYLLHGLPEHSPDPADGWKLLVVMPGGTGDDGFAPFVGRIRTNALERGWLVAQIVAPKWSDEQAKSNVSPTEKSPAKGMKRSTEALFDLVLDDLGKRCKIDPKNVYTLAWSSSGPAAYAIALAPKSRVTGSFVAMSVFRPEILPPLKNANGRRFYLFHSEQDQTCPFKMAEQARDELKKTGAIVEFATYEGGHGWHGNLYVDMRRGIEWLMHPPKPSKDKPDKDKPGKDAPKGKDGQ